MRMPARALGSLAKRVISARQYVRSRLASVRFRSEQTVESGRHRRPRCRKPAVLFLSANSRDALKIHVNYASRRFCWCRKSKRSRRISLIPNAKVERMARSTMASRSSPAASNSLLVSLSLVASRRPGPPVTPLIRPRIENLTELLPARPRPSLELQLGPDHVVAFAGLDPYAGQCCRQRKVL